MVTKELNIKDIKDIVSRTLETIEKSKEEIYVIVENARETVESIKKDLIEVKDKTRKVIDEVDSLEIKDKVMRRRLVQVSKNFNEYGEKDIKEVYEQAEKIRIDYILKQQEEKSLRERRQDLEYGLKKAETILASAKKLITQVGLAFNYISGEISENFTSGGSDEDLAYVGMRVLEAREEERKRISREIHDGPAQSIANIVFKAEICKTVIEQDVEKGLIELEELKDSVRNTLNDIRKIIYDLRPMSIDDLGIVPTIEKLVSEFMHETGIRVTLKCDDPGEKVDSIIQLAVFRLIQESFNNIRKHSEAKSATLSLEFGTKYLILIITDTGKGFIVDKVIESLKDYGKSFGVLGLHEMVDNLHGEIQISSRIGKGTVIQIKLPVDKGVLLDDYKNYKNTNS
ncbi:MAG: sensor histidine kinase [Acidaminobacteraceae bacterium]